jgi:hypothetical protein
MEGLQGSPWDALENTPSDEADQPNKAASEEALARRKGAPTEAALVALQQAILSHALLPHWHQALDLRQKVTTENPTAVFKLKRLVRRHCLPSRDRRRSYRRTMPA